MMLLLSVLLFLGVGLVAGDDAVVVGAGVVVADAAADVVVAAVAAVVDVCVCVLS